MHINGAGRPDAGTGDGTVPKDTTRKNSLELGPVRPALEAPGDSPAMAGVQGRGQSPLAPTLGATWPWGLGGQTAASGLPAGSPPTSLGQGGGMTPGQTGEVGLIGQGAILQPAFFAQIVSAVVAGVTPFARAAANQQGGSSSEKSTTIDSRPAGAPKSISSTPCLPWGSTCGDPKG